MYATDEADEVWTSKIYNGLNLFNFCILYVTLEVVIEN